MNLEIFEWIEIEVPRCALTYGTGLCTAILGTTGLVKCFSTRGTCQAFEAYDESETTIIRLSKEGVPLPKGFRAYPVLTRIDQNSTSVNILASDPKFKGLGERGSLKATMYDFLDHDRRFDFLYSERVSGAAQANGIGYIPGDNGMFFGRLKARWTDYPDAIVRLHRAYMSEGILSDEVSFTQLLKKFTGPKNGEYEIEALDPLDFGTQLCPKPSRCILTLDLAIDGTTFDVTPSEVADLEYPASGRVTIGSEIMSFTRSGATFTVTRGVRGTVASAHSQGDTVQLNFTCEAERADDLIERIITEYTQLPASWLPLAEWEPEVTVWAPSILFTTDITTPTPVETLLNEFSVLGINIVPDETAAKLRLRVNRPSLPASIVAISDANILEISVDEDPDERITQVMFCHKRKDPTKGVGSNDDTSNYASRILTVNNDALDKYGPKPKTRIVFTRWLDQGDNATAVIISQRMLKSLEDAPKYVSMLLDAEYKNVALTSVVELTTDVLSDGTGRVTPLFMQAIRRSEPRAYHNIRLMLKQSGYSGRYGFITPNDYPVYSDATEEQKREGAFMVGDTLVFPDGKKAYGVI